MTTVFKSFFTVLALAAVSVSAQPAPKILVVDMAKLYDGHYKTQEQIAKIQGDGQKAQDMLQGLSKEYTALVEEYKQLDAQVKNPVLSEEAQKKARADAEAKMNEVKTKEGEARSFQTNAQRSLQERMKTFRDLLLEEISRIAVDIAKRKGATIVLDKAGPTSLGISNVLYFDPAYDITEDVSREINKDRPADLPAPAASAGKPAAPTIAPSAAESEAPSVTFPSVKK